jgi:hypothetical protein
LFSFVFVYGLKKKYPTRGVVLVVRTALNKTKVADLGVHVYARNLIAEYARVTPPVTVEAVRDQVRAILSRFYVNHKFDWDGYVALLCANYDVYGQQFLLGTP